MNVCIPLKAQAPEKSYIPQENNKIKQFLTVSNFNILLFDIETNIDKYISIIDIDIDRYR